MFFLLNYYLGFARLRQRKLCLSEAFATTISSYFSWSNGALRKQEFTAGYNYHTISPTATTKAVFARGYFGFSEVVFIV